MIKCFYISGGGQCGSAWIFESRIHVQWVSLLFGMFESPPVITTVNIRAGITCYQAIGCYKYIIANDKVFSFTQFRITDRRLLRIINRIVIKPSVVKLI